MKKNAVLLLVALVVAVAAAFVAPSLDAAARTDTQITAAGTGIFPKGLAFNGLLVQGSRFGVGVVVRGDGSAVGVFQTVLSATTLAGQPRSIALEGSVTRGTVDPGGNITLSGTATLQVDNGLSTKVPFKASATTSRLQLTVGTVELPRQTIGAGSIFIG